MDAILSFIGPVFWGLILLSALVFVHEGGHFLAARACGVRVLEFFLGMPCRFNIHHTSRRIGTKFGVTPLLIGGYAEICGMDPTEVACAPQVLACIHRHGTVELSEVAQELGLSLDGGYAEICGMDPTEVACAPQVLACIHRHGTVELSEVAQELGLSLDEVQNACSLLYGWGSIVPLEEDGAEQEEGAKSSDFPRVFAAVSRDAAGNTVYDGKAFDRAHATGEGQPWAPPMTDDEFFELERSRTYIGKGFWKRAFMLVAGIGVNMHATGEGQPWAPPMTDDEFFELERSRTYIGKGFWKRAFMLVAGIGVNILTGFLLVIAVYSVLGVSTPMDYNVLGDIIVDSPAQEAGLQKGDRVLSVNGETVSSWVEMTDALDATGRKDPVELELWRPNDQRDAFENLSPRDFDGSVGWAREHGEFVSVKLEFDDEGMLGINAPMEVIRLDPIQSCQIAIDNIVTTAQSVASLLNPRHTMEVLDNSTSVVGISVMSAQAAAEGPATFLNLAALISFSLGFMNLLPIPPLDGGKLVIEIIQAVTRRKVPIKVQTVISMVGIGLFGLLFVYMLGSDVIRFF